MEPFITSSYLTQVRRLKLCALNALKQYPIRVKSVDFIHHGENTTFKVTAKNGDKFLLRISRTDYHTKPALAEELKWLENLARKNVVPTPRPVRTKKREVIAIAESPGLDAPRFICVFRWIDGTFIEKSVSPRHMYEIGEIIAHLQKAAPKTKHRRYWNANGLSGTSPRFGSIDHLLQVTAKQQKFITRERKRVHRDLLNYERKFPKRMGFIHADVHFGNILNLKDRLGVIDFDDSGYGFHIYDLAVPLISAGFALGPKAKDKIPELGKALIEGYSKNARWDQHDDKILTRLITARRIMMLGWLNSRADNPRLKKAFKGVLKNVLKHLKDQGRGY